MSAPGSGPARWCTCPRWPPAVSGMPSAPTPQAIQPYYSILISITIYFERVNVRDTEPSTRKGITMTDRRPAAVVTGGGGGIGTAVALELARRGVAVVAMDNGVSVQGEPVNEPTAARTAALIAAEGGVARASSASLTDRAAVRALFAGVVAEFGALDIVVNTAGILRYPPFLDASEQDWRDVLDVHLNGYLNVLSEAVPLMVAAGYGRIVGVTSGAGTVRAAGDAAAYACAKRAVAAVTWQLAGVLPEDVALNALSPLAATRMTTRAVTRGDTTRGDTTRADTTRGDTTRADTTRADTTRGDTAQADTAQAAGGLDLSGLPPARDMAPLAAFLASQEAGSCRGRVIFSAGPELSVVSPPRLLEAVRTQHAADFAASLDTLVPVVLGPAEAGQRSTGGANARFGPVFDQPGTTGPVPGPNPANCLVISGSAPLAASVAAALARCGLTAIDLAPLPAGFSAAEAAVERAAQAVGGIDAVVIAPGPFAASGPAVPSWQEMMTGYAATAGHVLSHAGWLQAVARHAVRTSRPVRVVHLADR